MLGYLEKWVQTPMAQGRRHTTCTETACRMSCLLKRKGESHTSLKEHPFVSSMILIGRVLCKVTPAMPPWGLSPDTTSWTVATVSSNGTRFVSAQLTEMSLSPARLRAKIEQDKRISVLLPESQVQNLVLTVLYVPDLPVPTADPICKYLSFINLVSIEITTRLL